MPNTTGRFLNQAEPAIDMAALKRELTQPLTHINAELIMTRLVAQTGFPPNNVAFFGAILSMTAITAFAIGLTKDEYRDLTEIMIQQCDKDGLFDVTVPDIDKILNNQAQLEAAALKAFDEFDTEKASVA